MKQKKNKTCKLFHYTDIVSRFYRTECGKVRYDKNIINMKYCPNCSKPIELVKE